MADKKKPAENAVEGEKKKGGKLKLIIILIVALLILGGGGFAAWKFLLAPSDSADTNSTNGTDNATAPPPTEVEPTQTVTLDPFVVNLADPMGRRYLKLNIDLEAINAAAATEVGTAMPKIKDTLLLLLSSKTFGEINSLEQKIELKNEIMERMNQILGPSKIKNVYFTEFVVQ